MSFEEQQIMDMAAIVASTSEQQGQILLARTSWEIAESLIAAGYRKFEIVDEPDATADGGPAFGELKQIDDRMIKQGGLRIRDYFAARALQGIFANDAMISRFGKVAQAENVSPDVLAATAAYSVAESMLKERAK